MELKPYFRKVQYYETDAMGIVHHANYVHWMEEARVDLMDQIGWPYSRCAGEEGIDFALTGIKCEYKGMVRFGDTVRIEVFIAAMTHARMTVGYRMYSANGRLCFTGESGHFFYDRRAGKPVALKRVLPELYERFLSLCQKE